MSYNLDSLTQQLTDLQRQYNQLSALQSQTQLFPNQQAQVPQQMSFPQQPAQAHQIQYVEGLSGARLYQNGLLPNASEIIMDKNEDIFYKVSKDANGIPAKKIPAGRFVIEEEVAEEEPVFLTRKDFDDFKEEIRTLFKQNATDKPINNVPVVKGGTEK